jgi:hypothetical protein
MRKCGKYFAGLLLWLFGSSLYAGELVHASVKHDDKRYIVEIEMLLDAGLAHVQRLLTDYDHLTRLNSAIRESNLIYSLDEHTHRVHVVAEACVSFFCKRISQVQDVEELPGGVIIATVVPEKSDFDYAHARWKISAEGLRTRISFNTDLKPSFWVPPLIGPLLIEKKLREETLATLEGLERLVTSSLE